MAFRIFSFFLADVGQAFVRRGTALPFTVRISVKFPEFSEQFIRYFEIRLSSLGITVTAL